MAAGAASTATGVTVAIARDPALVRTVRLVAAAVARRTGRDEEFVEEVRLAVGEACALLVGEGCTADAPADDPVTVRIRIDARLAVDVTAMGEVGVARTKDKTTVSMSWPLG